MSYILDALRRADAERERGEVPGLHTQQFGVLPEDDDAPRRPRLLIGTIVVLVLAVAGLLAWNFLGTGEPAPKPLAQAPVALPPLPVTIAPAPPTPASQPPGVLPVPLASPRPASAVKEAAAPRAPARPPPVRRELPASAPVAAPDDRTYTQAELPESIRRELPKISYGGGSFSADKASRMAFLNGQVFHEGDTVAPGLVLKQIKQKGAILTYKGYRYELGS